MIQHQDAYDDNLEDAGECMRRLEEERKVYLDIQKKKELADKQGMLHSIVYSYTL
jgi:hypothetical protein